MGRAPSVRAQSTEPIIDGDHDRTSTIRFVPDMLKGSVPQITTRNSFDGVFTPMTAQELSQFPLPAPPPPHIVISDGFKLRLQAMTAVQLITVHALCVNIK